MAKRTKTTPDPGGQQENDEPTEGTQAYPEVFRFLLFQILIDFYFIHLSKGLSQEFACVKPIAKRPHTKCRFPSESQCKMIYIYIWAPSELHQANIPSAGCVINDTFHFGGDILTFADPDADEEGDIKRTRMEERRGPTQAAISAACAKVCDLQYLLL